MGGREQEKGEGPRRIMVNSDEDIIEALKEINKTLKVKSESTHQVREEKIKDGKNLKIKRIVKAEG
ncbi:MAG: hypothetical protein ABSC11_01760 [Smithella sp.]|jgi:hypothetical protein